MIHSPFRFLLCEDCKEIIVHWDDEEVFSCPFCGSINIKKVE